MEIIQDGCVITESPSLGGAFLYKTLTHRTQKYLQKYLHDINIYRIFAVSLKVNDEVLTSIV